MLFHRMKMQTRLASDCARFDLTSIRPCSTPIRLLFDCRSTSNRASNGNRRTQLPDEHVSASYEEPSSTPPAFCCAWRPHRFSYEDSPLRSAKLCSPSTWNALPATLRNGELCRVISWSSPAEDWTLHESIFFQISILVTVFRVRVGEHNFYIIIIIIIIIVVLGSSRCAGG